MIDNWLVQYSSELLNVGNGIWITMSALVSYYMFRLFRSTDDPVVRNFSLGVLLVAIGSGMTRLWWFIGVATAPAGQTFSQWSQSYSGLTALCVLILAIGYSLHIKTALKERCGGWWWGRPTLAALIGAAAGTFLNIFGG